MSYDFDSINNISSSITRNNDKIFEITFTMYVCIYEILFLVLNIESSVSVYKAKKFFFIFIFFNVVLTFYFDIDLFIYISSYPH